MRWLGGGEFIVRIMLRLVLRLRTLFRSPKVAAHHY